jgi:inner membrane protease ATP23
VRNLQACVRRRAAEVVAGNPACPDAATAERVVNEVWDSCFNDTRPFDEVWILVVSF